MQAGRQEKHVRGCEGTVAGKGSHTIAFVRGLFPFSSLSLCSKFIIVVVFFLGLLLTVKYKSSSGFQGDYLSATTKVS